MRKPHNLTNRTFGKLLVLAKVPNIGPHIAWRCSCDCGNITTVTTTHLISGHTASCGCLKREKSLGNTYAATHGHTHTPEFKVWQSMKCRCLHDPKYIGRIKVCSEWLASFPVFLTDMGIRPTSKHTIERVDTNQNYTPTNCIWATYTTQNRNRNPQQRRKTGISGVTIVAGKFRVALSNTRIGTYPDFLDACCARKSAENNYWC